MAYNGIRDTQFYKPDEIQYMVMKGWLEPGTGEGTYKLTQAGIEKADRELSGLDFELKVLLNFKINGNTEADPKTFK